jgi:deoxyribonucleoside regulator
MESVKKELAVKASILYFENNLSQERIAKELGISRSYVSQLLSYARDHNIVQIKINIDEFDLRMLRKEIELRSEFSNTEFYIMKSDSDDFTMKKIGKFAAPYISDLIDKARVIGVSLGVSVMNIISALEGETFLNSQNKTVVQVMGGLNNKITAGSHPNELVRKLSVFLNCQYYYLSCPALLENSDLKEALLEEESIKNSMKIWEQIDLILMGIGTADQRSTLFKGFPSWMAEMVEKSKASGELNINFFDINGKGIPLLEKNKICLSLPIIKRIKKKVIIGYGEQKAKAIISALRAGCIDILITDSLTADAIERYLEKDRLKA